MKHQRPKKYKPRHRKKHLLHLRNAIRTMPTEQVIGCYEGSYRATMVRVTAEYYDAMQITIILLKRYHPNVFRLKAFW
jgi:hypothetical protein